MNTPPRKPQIDLSRIRLWPPDVRQVTDVERGELYDEHQDYLEKARQEAEQTSQSMSLEQAWKRIKGAYWSYKTVHDDEVGSHPVEDFIEEYAIKMIDELINKTS